MTLIPCPSCAGDGRVLQSRRGGTDPDIIDLGPCEPCHGSGNQKCENRKCDDDATGFNDDGEALCQDCLIEWAMNREEG